jgi:hypothetical protein
MKKFMFGKLANKLRLGTVIDYPAACRELCRDVTIHEQDYDKGVNIFMAKFRETSMWNWLQQCDGYALTMQATMDYGALNIMDWYQPIYLNINIGEIRFRNAVDAATFKLSFP